MNNIINIAKKNGYGVGTILKLENRINKQNQQNKPPKKTFFGAIDYTEGLSESIVNVFKKHNINIGIKINAKLVNIVKKDHNQTNDLERNGVYQIPITRENGENMHYIGMTKRKLRTRRSEHMGDIKFGRSTSAMAKLNIKENIDINFAEMKLIYPFLNWNKSIMRESIEIEFGGRNPVNHELSYIISRIWAKYLRRTNRKRKENTTLHTDINTANVTSDMRDDATVPKHTNDSP